MRVNREIGGVEVRLMFTPDEAGRQEATIEVSPGAFRQVRGRYTYSVVVRGERRPHTKLVGEIAADKVHSRSVGEGLCSVLAGALAEELNERRGDVLEPSIVARAAGEAFREMYGEQRRALLQNTH